MAKRMIHDNIFRSRKIDALSSGAEVLYYRLYTQLDDCGNFPDNITMIKGHCYPLKAKLTSKTIQKWLDELTRSGLAVCVRVGDEQLVHFQAFEQFQTLKHRTQKFGVTNKSQKRKIPETGGDGVTECDKSSGMGSVEPITGVSCRVSTSIVNETGSQEKLSKEKITRVVVFDRSENQESESEPQSEPGTGSESGQETQSGIEHGNPSSVNNQRLPSSDPNEGTSSPDSTPTPRRVLRDWAEDVNGLAAANSQNRSSPRHSSSDAAAPSRG
jgi:hypothetical protein